ncbi:hypothetical protein [Paenibacillus phytorum]|uniref:hypothetical protein n=1 Tax=Paenibacillus phytorum TaxID=2654977 RepID=UPI001C0F9F39|nr:hypothetical protein [Paenibacillus phytorum]
MLSILLLPRGIRGITPKNVVGRWFAKELIERKENLEVRNVMNEQYLILWSFSSFVRVDG